jgi:hypothetical protein
MSDGYDPRCGQCFIKDRWCGRHAPYDPAPEAHGTAAYDTAPAVLTVVAQHPCGGLPARCPECVTEYRRAVAGARVPLCVICHHRHWAYDDHIYWPVPGED